MAKWPVVLVTLDSVGEEGVYALFCLWYVSFARQVWAVFIGVKTYSSKCVGLSI